MSASRKPAARLARTIHTVNHGWKTARERFGADDALTQGLRSLKNRLQVQLLRHPDVRVRLRLDDAIEHEDVYTIETEVLEGSDGRRIDAAHIPYRIIAEHMEEDEIAQLLRTYSNSGSEFVSLSDTDITDI